tara:strand:+ start:163 stop:603 length:441 start_codon:yes stop_codon:yes gene_type:complete
MRRRIAIIVIITLIPALSFSQGKISVLKKGQKAPFNGILFDKQAEATMTAKRESVVKICNLEKDYQKKGLEADCSLSTKTLSAQLSSEQAKHKALMKIKDGQVSRLTEALKESNKPDYHNLWFAGGFVAGVALSLGIFYAAVEIKN